MQIILPGLDIMEPGRHPLLQIQPTEKLGVFHTHFGAWRYVSYPGKDIVELIRVLLFHDPVKSFIAAIFHKSLIILYLLFIMTLFRTPVLLIMTALISHFHTKNVIPKNFLQ